MYIIGLEDSSESETDNNDETGTTDKFLLLIDQLSSEQPHHLSIKDIGIILDRLRLVLLRAPHSQCIVPTSLL